MTEGYLRIAKQREKTDQKTSISGKNQSFRISFYCSFLADSSLLNPLSASVALI